MHGLLRKPKEGTHPGWNKDQRRLTAGPKKGVRFDVNFEK